MVDTPQRFTSFIKRNFREALHEAVIVHDDRRIMLPDLRDKFTENSGDISKYIGREITRKPPK